MNFCHGLCTSIPYSNIHVGSALYVGCSLSYTVFTVLLWYKCLKHWGKVNKPFFPSCNWGWWRHFSELHTHWWWWQLQQQKQQQQRVTTQALAERARIATKSFEFPHPLGSPCDPLEVNLWPPRVPTGWKLLSYQTIFCPDNYKF